MNTRLALVCLCSQVPFAINQCGSVFFALSLAGTSMGTVATVVNALTFLFTAIVDACIGHQVQVSSRLALAVLLIVTGAHLTITASTQV